MSAYTCRKAFTETLLELARTNRDILAITSDARGSVTLNDFVDTLPKQFVEIGIAEQNAVGVAAGLATCGKIPFVCSPAPFLSARSFEQIKLDVAYSNTNVKLIGVSGGVSYGALGGSHQSLQDIAAMRAISGLMVLLPCDARQTRWFTKHIARITGPVYMRMGRNPVPDVYTDKTASFQIGVANCICNGDDLTIIATGEMVYHAVRAASKLKTSGVYARVLDMHTIKPLDEQAIVSAAMETGCILTVEEHSIFGGLGSAVAEVVTAKYPVPVRILGIPDTHVITGESPDVFAYYRLDANGIAEAATTMLAHKK
ncbi:MAG: transketolase C-terminal domain-containing protein [Clostridia bacterium]